MFQCGPRPSAYNIPTSCTSATCGCSHSCNHVNREESEWEKCVAGDGAHSSSLRVEEILASHNSAVRASGAAFHDEFTSWAEKARSAEALSFAKVSSTRPLRVKSNASTASSDRALLLSYSPRSTTPFDRTSRHPRWKLSSLRSKPLIDERHACPASLTTLDGSFREDVQLSTAAVRHLDLPARSPICASP